MRVTEYCFRRVKTHVRDKLSSFEFNLCNPILDTLGLSVSPKVASIKTQTDTRAALFFLYPGRHRKHAASLAKREPVQNMVRFRKL